MKTNRSIEKIIAATRIHWVGDGFRVHTFFPGTEISPSRMSPFFLMDYNPKFSFPPSDTPKGVGVHPHRGFETVTFAYHGNVAHHDSAGNSGIIHPGDVQWMTAASGILHKEYHEKNFSKAGGDFQMVQLWVNLPAKDKMSSPKYQAIRREEMGKFELLENSGQVNIIAGNYQGVKGPASTFTPIQVYDLRLNTGGKFKVSLPAHYNTAMLVIDGKLKLEENEVNADAFVLFRNDATDIEFTALENSSVLLLSGEALQEPIAHYGPFVMNTREEIQTAFADYSEGKFGHLQD